MRRHLVSAMYNNLSYMYINISQKRYLANRLARKTKKFMHRVISHCNKLRMVEDISMDGKNKLEKLSKKIKRQRT